MGDQVWIVQEDSSPDYAVLGVFLTEREASAFADEVLDRFEDGVLYSSFEIPYRYDRGPGYVEYGPGS